MHRSEVARRGARRQSDWCGSVLPDASSVEQPAQGLGQRLNAVNLSQRLQKGSGVPDASSVEHSAQCLGPRLDAAVRPATPKKARQKARGVLS